MAARWLDQPGCSWKKRQRNKGYGGRSYCQAGKEFSVVSVRMCWMPATRRLGTGMVAMIVVMMVMVVGGMGMRMIRGGFNAPFLIIMVMVQEGEMERVGERLQRQAEAHKGSKEPSGCFLWLSVNHLVDPQLPR